MLAAQKQRAEGPSSPSMIAADEASACDYVSQQYLRRVVQQGSGSGPVVQLPLPDFLQRYDKINPVSDLKKTLSANAQVPYDILLS